MFDLPGRKDVAKCRITKDVIDHNAKPLLELREPEAKPVRRRARAEAVPLPEEPSAS